MKIALILSGGGARGIAHLGVIKAIEESQISISCISGTSSGAVIGALYSYGYDADTILEKIVSTSFFKLLRPSLSMKGMLHMDGIGKLLKQYLPENSFSALKVPTFVASTNLKKGQTDYFDSGELITPLLCSSCIPVVFSPVSFNGNLYVDGGILNNLPVSPVKQNADFIIGSHCNPIADDFQSTGFRKLIERTMLMAINGNVNESKKQCDFVIEPEELKKFGGFEINKAEKIFAIGYEAAKKEMKALNRQIIKFKANGN